MDIRPLRTTLAGALAIPLLFTALGAQAHAHLVKATPAANVATRAPASLHLQFSEKLEPKFSGVDLVTASGAAVAANAKVAGKTIDAAPRSKLAPGGYVVMWHVLSADGHRMAGKYSFTVK